VSLFEFHDAFSQACAEIESFSGLKTAYVGQQNANHMLRMNKPSNKRMLTIVDIEGPLLPNVQDPR